MNNPHHNALDGFYTDEVSARSSRPLEGERGERLAAFIEDCLALNQRRVLEVGAGAARDGRILSEQLQYTGVDLTPASVAHCRGFGLDVRVAAAESLPFEDESFDASWSMSTLMHLPDEPFAEALDELRRVVRPRGLIEIGGWGHEYDRDWIADDGRYFRHRSDATLRTALRRVGEIVEFSVRTAAGGRGSYQIARIVR